MFKSSHILIILLCLSVFGKAQPVSEKVPVLYGVCSKEMLMAAPYDTWFSKNYNGYVPDSATLTLFKKEDLKDISIKIFFGTWCGDSKREVPRFMKLMDQLSFPSAKISLIATGASDSLYKQSPQHEEAGLGIYKVPTFIIYRKGKEINRINEFPALSLERDLLQIVQGQQYKPNYASFAAVDQWMNNGTLTDVNVSSRSMAGQLRSVVQSENELNSLGYVLLAQQKKKEAVAIFLVNYYLYPQSANIASSLGEGYYENGDYKNAVYYLEYALSLNKDPKAMRGILDILYKAKASEK